MNRRITIMSAVLHAALIGPVVAGMVEGYGAMNGDVSTVDAISVGITFWSILAVPLLLLGGGLLLIGRLAIGKYLSEVWRERPGDGFAASIAIIFLGWWLSRTTGWAATFVGDRVKDHDLVAPAVSIAALGFAAIGIAVLGLLWFSLNRLVSRLPTRVQRIMLVLVLSLGPLCIVYGPASVLAKDLPWDPVLLFLLALTVSGVSLCVQRGSRGLIMSTVLLAGIVTGSWLVGPSSYSNDATLRAAFADSHGLTPLAARQIQARIDRDGDGFSPVLGGGDCNDSDATISPFSVDIPGNGIDEDCRDGDRQVASVVARKKVEHIPLDGKWVRKWNVLIVTIDALRADHLNLYGYHRETAPNIYNLGQEGLVFDRAYATSNATRYTLPTMFSGRLLADMNLERMGGFLVVGSRNELLFERLQTAGWHTMAHLPYQLKRGMWFGLDRGVNEFVGHKKAKLKGTSVPALTAAFDRTIKKLDPKKPWAMWVHIMEPHEPYLRHKRYPYGNKLIDRYDAEIRAADSGVGRFLRALKSRGMDGNTVIVITSDHGEEFHEHGRRFHGKQLYEESILVPLVIHIPGAPAKRVDKPVSLMDLPATIANLTGLEPGTDFGGISLVGPLAGREVPADRSIYIDCILGSDRRRRRTIAMVTDDRKIIYNPIKKRARMFDLAADPSEKKNLRANPPPAFKADLAKLSREVERQDGVILDQLRRRRVGKNKPPGLGKPFAHLHGLSWLGAHTGTRVLNGSNMLQIRNWFSATGKPRDYRLRLEIVDRKGKVRRTWVYRPLAGKYPTTHLAPGEVLEDARLLRFRKLKGIIKVRMTVFQGGKVVAGPRIIGAAKASTYY